MSGFKFPLIETDFGNVGLMVGWDLAFPKWRAPMCSMARICSSSARNWEKPNDQEWRTYLMSRAYENTCFIVAANRIGTDATLNFFGQSMIVGPRGQYRYASVG